MRRHRLLLLLCPLGAALMALAGCARRDVTAAMESRVSVQQRPHIRPDYTDAVIPPNIAPLNFLVQEEGGKYFVRIQSQQGKSIDIVSRTPRIVIPVRPWRKLLDANRGQQLRFEVYVKGSDQGEWRRFETITNTIAREDIDGYVVYRLIKPLYNYWRYIGVYQRDLGSYEQTEVIHGGSFDDGCLNCHTFLNNRTDSMTVGIRSKVHGGATLLVQNGVARKIGTKFGYTSWHPSGRLAAYSLNRVRQFFHAAGMEVRDVVDLESAVAIFHLDSMTVTTSPQFSNPDRLETYPTWSPDGRYLYFCSAPIPWADRHRIPPERYDEVRYSLMRISYDLQSGTWGELETVLSADETGKSILLPRISPDGRFLVFCMCKYGCFPIYQPTSDLYLMDLETGQHRRLPVNSDRSESWHSWSSNSRWLAFSSKRRDGLFTRTYFSYIDETGRAHKPFILPQEDPAFYDSCLKTYTVPELVVEPIRTTAAGLGETARSLEKVEVDVPIKFSKRKGPQTPDQWQDGGSAPHQ